MKNRTLNDSSAKARYEKASQKREALISTYLVLVAVA